VAGLDQFTTLAKAQYDEHLAFYVKAVLKKALGRLYVGIACPWNGASVQS